MKLLWHLLVTDLWRFRLLIAVWIALLAADAVIYVAAPDLAGDVRLFGAAETSIGLLWLARQILTIALVPMIVHGHPAVGSTAFWMTRPIPPRTLIASKVLLVFGVMVGVPVAADLVMAVGFHMAARETLFSSFQVLLANVAWVTALMTLAVLTRTFAQFALAWGIVIAGAACMAMVAGMVAALRIRTAPAPTVVAVNDPAIPIVFGAIIVAGLAATWIVQYVRRRRADSIPVGVAGVCLALVFGASVEPPLITRHTEPAAWTQTASLQLAGPAGWWVGNVGIDGPPPAILRSRVVMPEMPSGWFATAELESAAATAGDRTIVSGDTSFSGGARIAAVASKSAAERLAIREALGVDRVLGSPEFGAEYSALFVTSKSETDRLAGRNGTYRGAFRLHLQHVEQVAALPLARGATFGDGTYRIAIHGTRTSPTLTTFTVDLRQTRTGAGTLLRRGGNYELYLRNRNAREAAAGYIRPRNTISVFPIAFNLASMANTTPGIWTEAASFVVAHQFTPEWLQGAQLVVMRTTFAATIDRTLDISNFEWPRK